HLHLRESSLLPPPPCCPPARRPPAAAPFPYTTLFRSQRDPAFVDGAAGIHLDRSEQVDLDRRGQAEIGAGELVRRHVQLGPALVDRKSTRLNSSHVSISYAVFCLKKKKSKAMVVDLGH